MKLGVILGSGAEKLDLSDLPVEVINRFGVNHNISPSQVSYEDNARDLKSVGCTHVLCSTAVGSFSKFCIPGSIAVPDDFIDFSGRNTSVFKDFSGGMKHQYMGKSLDNEFRSFLQEELRQFYQVWSGTIVTIDGPRFSTLAESSFYRSMGATFINMTTSSEVVPIIELDMVPCVVGVVTDFDTCLEYEEGVTKTFSEDFMLGLDNPSKIRKAVEIALTFKE